MRIGIVGSRAYPNLSEVFAFVAGLPKDTIVVSGGARGVDSAAERAAFTEGLGVISIRPYKYTNMAGSEEWSFEVKTKGEIAQAIVVERSLRIGPPHFRSFAAAAFARNAVIVGLSDRLAAFHDGVSRGTLNTIDTAKRNGIEVEVRLSS